MGEHFDARRDDPDWCRPGLRVQSGQRAPWSWESAIRAEANGSTKALFSDNCGSREVDLGFQRLAVRLFQSRRFPSWGYEVVNGASSVWKRWDSFTREHGFDGIRGKNNAVMNSFSHYAFGAVAEWMFRVLAGIDTNGPGFKRIILRPHPPAPDSNPERPPIHWVNAEYDSIQGRVVSRWKRTPGRFEFNAVIPPNTTATVFLPARAAGDLRVNGRPLTLAEGVQFRRLEGRRAVLEAEPGEYQFASTFP
ncbi:MAG: hypothetical protein JXQ71_08105 [Verrucomicrobia bacterium]|nr:hypothetical protein [Verrucomicrobiota bacterium]